MWTSHGHHIPGTDYDEASMPSSRARCGGTGLCMVCTQEAKNVKTAAPEESNLVKHARRELKAVGEDEQTTEGLIKVVQAFSDMGHSGASAGIAVSMLEQLLRFKPLTDLTDDPNEWVYHGPEMWPNAGIWQNVRNGEAFSTDGGKTYTLLRDKQRGEDPIYTSKPHQTKTEEENGA